MKPILKSGRTKTHKFVKSELFFEVKPYTQTVIFTEKIPQENIDSTNGKNDELEDLDRHEVHNLEKWIDYNKHKQISSMFNEVKIKQLEKEKKLKEMSEKNVKDCYYRFPEIRPSIVNQIMDQGKHICLDNKNNVQSKPKYYKSFETIKTEANKMIVNELIYRKVSNKMKNPNNSDERAKTAISSVSTMQTQTNEPPVQTDLTNNTINNFKHLQQLFLTYKQSQVINYPDLISRIQNANQTVEKLFDYTDEIKKIKDDSKKNLEYEGDLLEEFDTIKKKIQEKKQALEKIRMQNASNNSKLSHQNETSERIRFRLQNNFEYLMNKAQKNNTSAAIPHKNKKEESQLGGNMTIEEFMQIQKINEEKEKTEKMIKNEIEKIKKEMNSNNFKLESIEKEVAELRQKKLHYQLELKDIYISRLKEELKQENNESISWIIKAFWRIDKEFNSESFPSDLDPENINYIFKMAQLEQELLDLRAKQRYEILSMAHGDAKNSKGLLNRDYQDHLDEIRSKFKFMKKEKFQIKKSSNKMQYRSAIEKKLEEEMLEDYFKKCLGNLDINDLEPKDVRDEEGKKDHKNYEIQIKNKIELLDQTKQKEIQRIFHKFKHVSNEDSEFKIFLKVVRVLFGNRKIHEILLEFDKFKEDIRNKDLNLSNVEKIRPKTSRSHSDYGRLGTAKSSGGLSKQKDQKEEPLKDYEEFFNKMTLDPQAVNYKYNMNYNYTPKIQNYDDINSLYFKSRVQTAKTNKNVHF